MTVAEFFGCAFLAFGPCLAMFSFTIAHDPIRIIILIAAAFFWLVALLLSSVIWFAVVPLRDFLAFGLVFSVIFQVGFGLKIWMHHQMIPGFCSVIYAGSLPIHNLQSAAQNREGTTRSSGQRSSD